MFLARLIAMLILILTLSSCMDAAVTGAQMAYNHSSIQNSLSDQYISLQADRRLFSNTREFSNANIDIATFNREVLMTGQIPSKEERIKAETILKDIPGVEKVYNLTQISTPISPLKKISDIWITTKIRSQLIAYNEIDPTKIKVVTENGTVYLMGIVMADQADLAVDIARTTQGVERVVKILTYLRISKV